ncbi:MAG TPA: hypothetical protein DCM05_13250 [Elusimicrobia bacterium]|nr:hypothetical protein [Elusimicrobiota bacterium]
MSRSLALLAAVLLLLGACLWLDLASPLSARLRSGRPVNGLLSLSVRNQEAPPDLYALVLGPSAGTLDLISLPDNLAVDASSRTLEGLFARGGRTAVEEAALGLVSGSGLGSDPLFLRFAVAVRTPSPVELRGALASAASDPLFWLRLPGRLKRLGGTGGLRPYDALLLAWRLARLRPDAVSLSRPPLAQDEGRRRGRAVARLVPDLTAAVLSRAEGLKDEDPAALTAEILNASGASGVALRATKLLRWRGVDVVHFGNAPSVQPTVRIVVHSGGPETAQAVLSALGCPETDTVVELVPDPQTSVTVILGKDHLRCTRLAEETPF